MPDFQNLNYRIAIEPIGGRLNAWSKLRECERRLEMFKWVEALNDPARAQHRILLNDSASAYLLTYEAVIQFTKEQFIGSSTVPQFDQWFTIQPQYDVIVRGLRTLRHFEAHVELKSPQSKISASSTKVSRTWGLPPLHDTDLARLRTKPLSVTHLNDWSNKVDQDDAASILTEGLVKLKAILEAAEGII
jgi:hypothetical protein